MRERSRPRWRAKSAFRKTAIAPSPLGRSRLISTVQLSSVAAIVGGSDRSTSRTSSHIARHQSGRERCTRSRKGKVDGGKARQVSARWRPMKPVPPSTTTRPCVAVPPSTTTRPCVIAAVLAGIRPARAMASDNTCCRKALRDALLLLAPGDPQSCLQTVRFT